MRSAVDTSHQPVDVLERCYRRGDIFSGRAVILVEALCVHPLQSESIRMNLSIACSLVEDLEQFDEARAFLQDRIPEAIQALGKDADLALKLQRMYAQCLYENDGASREDVTAAIATLEDIDRRQTRIFGAAHPQTVCTRYHSERAVLALARK